MAVYTQVSDAAASEFLARYDLGPVRAFRGIEEGIENSNFLLETPRGRFILTLFERRVAAADLPWFVALMRHLAARGVRCPEPVAGRDGEALGLLCGRPALVTTFLPGAWPRTIAPAQCAEAGAALARLHVAGRDFEPKRANDLGVEGWPSLLAACAASADEAARLPIPFLREALAAIRDSWPARLQRGAVHADLFPDNVFFADGAVSGIIDFYFACTDFLAYDLAVTLVAWCFGRDGTWCAQEAAAMLRGYEGVRVLDGAERAALPVLLQGAALRFALTRLYDRLHPVPGIVRPKDPMEFVDRLRRVRDKGTVESLFD